MFHADICFPGHMAGKVAVLLLQCSCSAMNYAAQGTQVERYAGETSVKSPTATSMRHMTTKLAKTTWPS